MFLLILFCTFVDLNLEMLLMRVASSAYKIINLKASVAIYIYIYIYIIYIDYE